MASKSKSFWSRLFRGSESKARQSDDARHMLDLAANKKPWSGPSWNPLSQSGQSGEPSGAQLSGPPAGWNRREDAIVQLQEGYKQVTQVVENIQQYLVQHGQRTERIATSLEQLQQVLGDIPAISRRQAEMLAGIANHLETTNVRTEQLTEAVGQIPAVAKTQAETLAGMNQQIEKAGDQAKVTSQALDKLGTAITTLGQASFTQADAIKMMNAKAEEQGRVLNTLIANQSKRFVWLFVITVLLAMAAVVASIVGIASRG